ncbi:glycosyltransferase family 49 protein [Lichtheimia corymbifera JMRC:FSU:9682]|uniref:Glycosyltransferase family 49 protein n=1 Tax=Lichtheimia corymbifera JMRC:FSU:9682 TaxID=1263082 RepID=A0A068RRS5_9FUNG|nr:glycosyltransferase family 49 protein [Lichtheimia corymbifera JMRC:FSU:9682]
MRLEVSQAFSRGTKYFLVFYTIVSLILTARHFYSYHASEGTDDDAAIFPRADENKAEMPLLNSSSSLSHSKNSSQLQVDHQALAQSSDSSSHPADVAWPLDNGNSQSMDEDYVLSKIFSEAMGPSNLTPYYRRASASVEKNDITMATLVTRNRFKVLSRLATHYKGPISAAIHVNDDDTKQEVLDELHAVYESNPDMQSYVDIHLMLDNFDRQFNLWRNVAKFFARTDYIMMLDVDFHLCTNFRQRIRNDPKIMALLDSGTAALVVPAFEFNLQDDGLDWRTFPTTKSDLLQEVESGKLDMFHKSWLRGHGSTNYTKWYASEDLYKVTDYNFSYEPYIIYKKEGSPWCSERFIGYGANKAACLYEIYISGIDYWVLPDDFLIHQTHEYPEATRRKERQYNRKLYSNFREELCLRYARLFVSTGDWDSSKADNLRDQCHRIRGFRSAMNLA